MERGGDVALGKGSRTCRVQRLERNLPCLGAVSSMVGIEHGRVWERDKG